jgi:hypothetical protein
MRPVRTRRRVLESLAKTKALVAIKADSRLQHHALCEAVLNQIEATWIALIRQVGDAHGLKPETIQSLNDLTEQLSSRHLVSLEAQKLNSLSIDQDGWLATFRAHRAKASCPNEVPQSTDSERIPMTDATRLDRLKNDRYADWVEELSDLVSEFQNRFDES